MLEELNLLDDFLFNKMMSYPGIREEFSKELLRIIFQREFGNFKVVAQKVYYGNDVDLHGARLDVYLEEEGVNVCVTGEDDIYNLEPDQKNSEESIRLLPRRTRFYHSIIDTNDLKSGESYQILRNVIVIIITPYDPFGLDRMIYTVKNCIVEDTDAGYDDGARTIYLYTKGTQGRVNRELKELLRYMEDTTAENACNESLKRIHKMVKVIKEDKDVTLGQWKMIEKYEYWRNEALKEGRAEGRAEERKNTEEAERRAEAEKQRADNAERELAEIKRSMNIA